MTATTLNATALNATALVCPESQATVRRARPQGVHRVAMVLGMALTTWARNRADEKAMVRTRHPLSALNDYERAELYREATELREQAYASRSRWHVVG